jgi:hypothetical protein
MLQRARGQVKSLFAIALNRPQALIPTSVRLGYGGRTGDLDHKHDLAKHANADLHNGHVAHSSNATTRLRVACCKD